VSTAAQAAIMLRSALYVPGTPVGYRIDTPINLTNLAKSLTIYGDGINGITYGAALEPLNGGSLFLGNTGTGKAVFDCAGSSNLLFRGINITSLAQSTPSTIGILFGTSTTAVALQAPGGASCSLENVSIQLQNANNSVPVYFAGGAGLSHFQHVWTLGVHGIYLTANNELALSSEYVTLGPVIGVAGVKASGCNLLGYGGAPVLSLEVAHNQRWSQTYLATIFGGPAYAGQPYACKVKDSIDVKIEMEVDYFPTPLLMDGDCRNCHFFGSTFPHATPLGASDGIIAFFAGEVLRNCHFWITPSLDDAPVNNYHYTTNGVTASMVAFQSCTFLMDSAQSTFIAFLNATDDIGVPFFNLSFDGDADVGTYDFRVDGVSAGEETKRYFINGVLFGSA
jgi:hypothetical protein